MEGISSRSRAALVALAVALPAQAQVVMDGTLGPAIALPGPGFAISDTLGRQVGTNLFHSFRSFNLSAGQTATFSGPGGTTNVISRVTGGSPSSIDGTIRSTIAGANLYLINPKGIAFGPNAQLDVGGAFHASTATHIKLGSSGVFRADKPGASVLTVDPPSAFGFAGDAAPITVDRSRLWVSSGKALSLVAGDISIKGRGVASGIPTLWAPGGTLRVEASGDIALSDALVVTDLPTFAAGPISIRGGKLTLDASAISARNERPGPGSDIDIKLSGDLLADNDSTIRSSAIRAGDAGDTRIEARNVTLAGSSIIETSSVDLNLGVGGRAGGTTIEASGAVALSEGSEITSISFFGPAAGEMRISAQSLDISSGASLNASTFGNGAGGRIVVDAGSVRLSSGGHIIAGSLFDSRVAAGTGTGGDVLVSAGSVDIAGAGSGLFSVTDTFGSAGTIAVSADTIRVADGGRISSASTDPHGFLAVGDAGSIDLRASRSILLENDGAITTEALAAGGGIVNIEAGDVLGLAGSRITTSVGDGTGNGGDINIDPVFVVLNQSEIIARAVGGNGGDITIVTQFLLVSPGSAIDASSRFGLSGRVLVTAPEFDAGSRLGGLASSYVDPSSRLRDSCASRAGAGNSFVGVGRGGLPASPASAAFAAYGFLASPAPLASAGRSACPS